MFLNRLENENLLKLKKYSQERNLVITSNAELVKKINLKLLEVDEYLNWTLLESPSRERYIYVEKRTRNPELMYNVELAVREFFTLYSPISHPFENFYLARINEIRINRR